MPTPPHPDPTHDGARNLFLDADPIDDDALTEPDAATSKNVTPRVRGRGRVVAVDSPSPVAAATSHSARAARFTRPTAGIARLRMPARARIRGAAVLAGRLLSRVAARPSAPLTALIALIALAGLLIALGWLGLAFTDASAARRVAERRLAVATAMLRHDRARIDALSAQLSEAALTARRQQTTETAAHARRPGTERTPARGRHRRH
ncbi:MAG: hypothetical protein ABSH51_30055 [Solirubrobacteraceae bacterium]|jgi:hypothetical protein